MGDCSNRKAEKRVRLQFCLLVSTLDFHGFGLLINLVRFLDKRAASSNVGYMASLLIRLGLSQTVNDTFPFIA